MATATLETERQKRRSAQAGGSAGVARTGQGGGQGKILKLQRLAGNRAVGRLLSAEGGRPSGWGSAQALPPELAGSLGEGLPPGLRLGFEARFGHDFSQVRLHRDGVAAELAQAADTPAFTWGRDIFLAPGAFAPETAAGLGLLAHELTHVVQQSRGGGASAGLQPDSPLEQAAHQASQAVVSGRGSVQVQGASAPGLACFDGGVEPHKLSDADLYREVQWTRNWLLNNVGNPEYDFMEERLRRLEHEAGERVTPTSAGKSSPGPSSSGPSPGPLALMTAPPGLLRPLVPFAVRPTPGEWGMIQAGKALHYTPAPNVPAINQPGGLVQVNPSQGIYRNLLTPGFKPSAYFFLNQPSRSQQILNIAGQGALSEQGLVIVQGGELPPTTLFRPLDRVIVVPGGYQGPGAAVEPHGQIPLPLRLPAAGGTTATPTAPPSAAPPPTSRMAPGTGMAVGMLGLSLLSGYARQKAMEREVEEKGYAMAGPRAFAEEGFLMRLGRFFQDPTLGAMTPPSSRFNVTTWRKFVRSKANAVAAGGTLEVTWQFHTQDEPFSIFPKIIDVDVTYEKQGDGTWRARPPKDTPKGFSVPDINRVISDSVPDSEIMTVLFPGTTA